MNISYPSHLDFKLIFYGLVDQLEQLESFLIHMQSFIVDTEEKLTNSIIHSVDCCDYQHAGAFGATFRNSFVVTLCSVSETFIKDYIKKCKEISNLNNPTLRKESVMDYLKDFDKGFINLGIDFTNKMIIDFKGLLALRNSIVHSSGTFEDVIRYKPQIIQLAKRHAGIEIIKDHYIDIKQEFCNSSLNIVRYMFYYLIKLAIRRYYNFISGKQYFEIENNCR